MHGIVSAGEFSPAVFFFERGNSMRILNFGSLNIDDVYSVDHFVLPGETIAPISYEQFPGGKGLNQSVALARAGADVYHAGKVGADGMFLRSLLSENGVHTDYLETADAANGRAIIQVDKTGQNCIILYGGTNRTITEEQVEKTLDAFGENDWLLLQNELNCTEELIAAGKRRGMTVVFNPSPFDASILSLPLEQVDWFFVNELEGSALSGGETAPEAILDGIRSRYPNAKIVLTLGKDGVIADDGKTRVEHGIFEVPTVDTTAAGDTFSGYFLASVTSGISLEEAVKIASAASAIAVSRKGASVSIPSKEEVLEFLANV